MQLIKSPNSLGGEIQGIELKKQLNEEQIQFINHSWDERLVLVFKNQNLNDYDLITEFSTFILKGQSYEAEEGHCDDLSLIHI